MDKLTVAMPEGRTSWANGSSKPRMRSCLRLINVAATIAKVASPVSLCVQVFLEGVLTPHHSHSTIEHQRRVLRVDILEHGHIRIQVVVLDISYTLNAFRRGSLPR
jgi:hypothetical protein